MRHNELLDALRKGLFEPFRIHLSNGMTYDVRHPEFAAITRSSLFVGLASPSDEVPDRMVQCNLLHVVAMEPINGQPEPDRR